MSEMSRYAPRPLSTSREYPGYQFYAVLRLAGHSAEECLRYAALTVQNWLCERIRNADGSVPEEILCPPPAEYASVRGEDLRSCKLSFCEIVSIPQQGIWAMMVREPHPEIAARAFVTHVGIRVLDSGTAEFGTCVEVVDRDSALPEEDVVYRPQFIRLLFETERLELRQMFPIPFRECTEIRDRRGMGRLQSLADDEENQLPLVVFTYAKRSDEVPEDIERKAAGIMRKPLLPPFVLSLFRDAPPVEEPEYSLPYDAAEFARHIYGFARAYAIVSEAFDEFSSRFSGANLACGDILMIEPRRFGGGTKVFPHRPGMTPERCQQTLDELTGLLVRYSKHKPYAFGSVLFVEEARQEAKSLELEDLRALVHRENSGEMEKLLAKLEEERKSGREQARQISQLRTKLTEEYRRGMQHGREQAAQLEKLLNKAKSDNAVLRKNNESMRQAFEELNAMKEAAAEAQNVPAMPRTCEDVALYFRKVFPDRIDFTERGLKTASKCGIYPEILWECLYSMATVLADLYRNGVRDTERQYKEKTGWEMAKSEGSQTRKSADFMTERTDVYQGREISVEPHIKFSNYARKTGAPYQRLYFAYDPQTRRIIVGYVGDHLKNHMSLDFH